MRANSLIDVPACPLCGSQAQAQSNVSQPNLYSEQLALVVGCTEDVLLGQIHNVLCADCGLWYKPRWFHPDIVHTLFTERVPGHPKGWDAVSDRFSEQGFAHEVSAFRRAISAEAILDIARYRRSLASIVDSMTGMDDTSLQRQLLEAITSGDINTLDRLQPALQGCFSVPAAFKRFSGFSSPALWEWMESYLGPVSNYGEVGCPLWGQLTRTANNGTTRYFFVRPENNYWGDGCCQGGQHCSQRLAAGGRVQLQMWPPAASVQLDAMGAFQYLDHLENPVAFVTEALRSARALLLILDAVDSPLAIQHFTGWDGQTIKRLAAMHGKRVADDFTAIDSSGNRAWLLY